MHFKAMKPIGIIIMGALHVAPYIAVVCGGEVVYNGLGWVLAGIMLNIEVNV